jgi:hypothetical protein
VKRAAKALILSYLSFLLKFATLRETYAKSLKVANLKYFEIISGIPQMRKATQI